MVSGVGEAISRTIADREADARARWTSFVGALAGAPTDPDALIPGVGGLAIPELGDPPPPFRSLADFLRAEGIAQAGYSHGGRYLFADPELYVAPPPWQERRRLVEDRLRRSIAVLRPVLPCGPSNFDSWLMLIATLDVVRTDLSALCWNEVWLSMRGHGAAARALAALAALRWCCAAVLRLLPPLCDRPREPAGPPPPFPKLDELRLKLTETELASNDAVRSRRADDDIFAIWAALARLAVEPLDSGAPSLAVGNAFGAIDLGCFVAEATPSTARLVEPAISWFPRGGSLPPHIQWPAGGAREWGKILFCDDSLTSGGTFEALRRHVGTSPTAAPVDGFFLTFDCDANRKVDSRIAEERFRLARHACRRAPWSPGVRAPLLDGEPPLAALRRKFRGSSDEQLRWIAGREWSSITALQPAAEAAHTSRTAELSTPGEPAFAAPIAALEMVLPPHGAAFISGPVESGRRRALGTAASVVDAAQIREENAAALDALADIVVRRTGRPTINPARFRVPGWRGAAYGAFFRRVIDRFAAEVWFIDGWQFSNGSVGEFFHCAARGIRCRDAAGEPLLLDRGRTLVLAAIAEIEAAHGDAGLLRASLPSARIASS